MPTLQELRAAAAKKHAEARAIFDKAKVENRDLTEIETKQIDALMAEVEKHKGDIQRLERLEANAAWLASPADTLPVRDAEDEEPLERRIRVPATVFPCTKLRAFRGPDAERRAYISGMWLLATLYRRASAIEWCRRHNLDTRAHGETTDVLGGFLVPTVMECTIIDLREQYGTFRPNARVVPMTSDTLTIPRRTGGLTAYAVGEGDSTTESDKNWDAVNAVARKWAVRTRCSSELAEDAIISVADDLTSEMVYALVYKEDLAGFTGDGTSTYHGINGVVNKINDGNHAASIVTSAEQTFSAVILGEFESMVGKLPEYAEANAKWYISRVGWAASMMRLADAAGGNTRDIIEGKPGQMFLGYPVVHVQVMNKTTTDQASVIIALFGDLRKAAIFGDRRGVSIAVSDQFHFDTDQIGIRATERYDINVHDLGDGTDAGPIIALKTAAA